MTYKFSVTQREEDGGKEVIRAHSEGEVMNQLMDYYESSMYLYYVTEFNLNEHGPYGNPEIIETLNAEEWADRYGEKVVARFEETKAARVAQRANG